MTVGYIIALYSTGVSTFGYDNGIVHGRDRCVGKADREEINTEGQYKRRGEEADKKNAAQIEKVEEKLNDLKADLPLIYVTREDYIRVMNRVEDKIDQILYSSNSKAGTAKGKEE